MRDVQQKPIFESRVVIFGQQPAQWGPHSRVVKTAETDLDGRFQMTGLLPGKYFAIAVAYLDDGAWLDGEVLTRLATSATPVTIAAGAHTLSLVLKPEAR